MFRLIKVTPNHRVLIVGPVFDYTLHLGQRSIDPDTTAYSCVVWHQYAPARFHCPWEISFTHQHTPVLPALPTVTAKALPTLSVPMKDDEEKTDPGKPLVLTESKITTTPAPLMTMKVSLPSKKISNFKVGEYVRVRETPRANYYVYRTLKQNDERGWYVSDSLADNSTAKKCYVEYDEKDEVWVMEPQKPLFPSTSTAMVVASKKEEDPIITVVEPEEPMIEETYSPSSVESPTITVESPDTSMLDVAAASATVEEPKTETPKVGNLSDYFTHPYTTSAKEEYLEHGSIALRQGVPLVGYLHSVCGNEYIMKEGNKVIIPTTLGYVQFQLRKDEDGWFVMSDDGEERDVHFNIRRSVWVIDRVL